jgi:hypothetical protein
MGLMPGKWCTSKVGDVQLNKVPEGLIAVEA